METGVKNICVQIVCLGRSKSWAEFQLLVLTSGHGGPQPGLGLG